VNTTHNLASDISPSMTTDARKELSQVWARVKVREAVSYVPLAMAAPSSGGP